MRKLMVFSILTLLSVVFILVGCKESYIWLEIDRTFSTDESPSFYLYSQTKPKSVDVQLYKIKSKDIPSFIDIYVEQKSIYDVQLKGLERVDVEYTYDIREGDYWYYGNYINVSIKPLKAGLYIVRTSASNKVAYGLINVSDTKLVVSNLGEDLVITVTDRIKGTALSSIDIYGYGPFDRKKTEYLGKTDNLGNLKIKYDWKREGVGYCYLFIYADTDKGPSFCEIYQWYSPEEKVSEYFTGHIYTDRPIYRPGQDVNFKLFARKLVEGRPVNIPGEKTTIVIKNPDGDELFKEEMKLSDFATCYGGIKLDDDAPLGYYYIDATIGSNYIESYFEVQEYRKPEFIVEATADRDYYLTGDTVRIKVDTNYYFGGPVKGAQVEWTATEYYGGGVISKGSGVTSGDGTIEISFKTSDKVENNYYIYVNIDVTDQSRRQVSSTVGVNVYYYDINLYVYAERYLVKVGDSVDISLNVSDIIGNPISKDVLLRIEQETYNEKKKEWEYKTVYEDEISIGKAGKIIYEYKPYEAGYYRIVCEAIDSRGHKLTSYGYFWATGGEYAYYWWWWDLSGGDAIFTDRTEYTVGDTALIQLNVQPEFAVVDLIVSGSKIYDVWHIPIENHSTSLELPIKSDYYPNVTLSLLYAQKDGYYYNRQDISVKDPSKSLRMSLNMDKKEYRPGDEARWSVNVTDYSGKPQIADVSLGMVDEALYAIREEDKTTLESIFYPYMSYLNVVTSDQFYYGSYAISGGASFAEGEGGIGAMDRTKSLEEKAAPMGAPYAEARVRKEFKDTGFWLPSVITGVDGIAKIAFKMPDNLTTWRTTIRGITKDTLTGEVREKTLTTKKLIVRLITPRTFTQKDKVTVSAVVTNYLPQTKKVKVYIEGDRIDLLSDKVQYINVEAGDTARVDWKVDIIGTGESTLTAYALTDIESDAMEVKVPIIPHGLKTVVYDTLVAVDGSSQMPFNIPQDVRLDSVKLRIDLSPSIASTAFKSLEYLAGYPYGCVEQTMSRFLPDVYLVNILQKTGLTVEGKLMEELPKMIDDGLTRLYDFQHDDGGWGWWKDDQTNPFMTAYVVYGLSMAREADIYVRDDVISRGVDSLKTQIANIKDKDINTICYMLYALSYAPGVDTAFVFNTVEDRKILKNIDDLNPYALSVLGTALLRSKLNDSALLVANELKKRAVDSGGLIHWDSSDIRGGWYDTSTETTSYILRFFIEMSDEDDYLQKIVSWLIKNRRGYYWYSTKDTSACVMALADYVEYTGEFEPNYKANVSINGKLMDSFTIKKTDLLTGHKEIKLKGEELKKGANTVEIDLSGDGRLYASYELTYYTPGENIESINKGITVVRSFDEKRKTPVNFESMEGGKLNVYLTLKVEEPVDYLILEDFKPAGCEYEEDYEFQKSYIYGWDWYYWWYLPYTIEVRDEKVCFFFDHLEPGEYKFAYKMRCETPGVFHTMPAVASAMYSPDFGGSSDEVILTIKAKRAD
ncbi:MAG: alpha-2-macroglobulin family protein [bacterium]